VQLDIYRPQPGIANRNPISLDEGRTYPGRWMIGNVSVVRRLPRLIHAPAMSMDAKGGYRKT